MKYTNSSVSSAHVSEYPRGRMEDQSTISSPLSLGHFMASYVVDSVNWYSSFPFLSFGWRCGNCTSFTLWKLLSQGKLGYAKFGGEVRQEFSAFPFHSLSGSKCLEMDFLSSSPISLLLYRRQKLL